MHTSRGHHDTYICTPLGVTDGYNWGGGQYVELLLFLVERDGIYGWFHCGVRAWRNTDGAVIGKV